MVRVPQQQAGGAVPVRTENWDGLLALFGAWSGWILVRLLAATGLVRFEVRAGQADALSYCESIGYPKQQDYFWYLLALLAAPAGAAALLLARRRLARGGWRGAGGAWPSALAVPFLALSSWYALRTPAFIVAALLLLAAGWALVFHDSRMMAAGPDEAPAVPDEGVLAGGRKRFAWAAVGTVLAVILAYDLCRPYRNFDPLHEGTHLVYIQSWLAGDLPGLDVKTEYAPLYLRSIAWWVRVFGLTVSAERWYFQAVQMAGAALYIGLLAWMCRRWVPLLAGAWGMITLTMTLYTLYGATNSLRLALPLASVVACWRAVHRGGWAPAAGAGVLAGVAFLYSHEYAAAGMAACLLVLLVRVRDAGWVAPARTAAGWAGGWLAGIACLMLLMFGTGAVEAFGQLMGVGYAGARLSGHGAAPFRSLPKMGDPADLISSWRPLFDVSYMWIPCLLGGAAAAWVGARWRSLDAGKRTILPGVALYMFLSLVPGIVRPAGQELAAAAQWVALAVLLLDAAWTRSGRTAPTAVVLAAALAVMGALRIWVLVPEFKTRLACLPLRAGGPEAVPPGLERLGRVYITPQMVDGLKFFRDRIEELCPPGSRIYLATPQYSHLLFFSDRAGMPPYPVGILATRPDQRAEVLRAFEKYKPPVVLLTEKGLENISFEKEHPEEWNYIKAHYRQHATVSALKLWLRKGVVPVKRPKGKGAGKK